MDGTLYWRYRRGGRDVALPAWESSAGLESWGDAPAPALVAKQFLDLRPQDALGRPELAPGLRDRNRGRILSAHPRGQRM